MAFTDLERLKISFKALAGSVKDADPAAAWYESVLPNSFVLAEDKVWTQADIVRANAPLNFVDLQNKIAVGPLLGVVEDRGTPVDAIRLSPVPGVGNTFAAWSIYADYTSPRLENWVPPTFVPKSTGLPSVEYAVRLYNGDPNFGGVEVFTTDGTVGTGSAKSVGWIFDYANGILLLASDFAASVPDPWITGFRYIGLTAGAGVTAASSNVFVFRPGGVADDPVFTDWNLLWARRSLLDGPAVIQIDDSILPATIPTGVYDLSNTLVRGVPGSITPTLLTVGAGADITGISTVGDNLSLLFSTGASTITPAAGSLFSLGKNSSIEAQGPATPMFSVSSGDFTMLLEDGASLTGINPVVSVAAGAFQLSVILDDGSSVAADTISGAVGSNGTSLIRSASSDISVPIPPAFDGTWTNTYLTSAFNVGYNPTNPLDWAIVPATVGEALDQLVLGSSSIAIYDEGVLVGSFGQINFIGADVLALDNSPQINVFIPPPPFLSHWNTDDGANGADGFASESIARATAHISTPAGGEGSPFSTGGWAGTDQSASLNTSVVITSVGDTTGFGGDSTVTVTVYDADGVTPLPVGGTVTTAPITADGPYGAGSIAIAITNFAPDNTRFSARLTVTVDVGAILTANGRAGGRYHIEVVHTPDSVTDGSGPYSFVQPDVFLDTNPTTPLIGGGPPTIVENVVVSKHLSGLEYYTLTSVFTVDVNTINQLNRNTSRINSNLVVVGAEYGLPALNHSPFGAGFGNFSGWTNNHNQDNVDYTNTGWSINAVNYRYLGPSGNISATPQDTWGAGLTLDSATSSILVDTYGVTSTNLFEDFDDESRRQDATFNGGTSPGNWVSTASLVIGEAQVWNSRLVVPNTTTFVRSDGPNSPNANWTGYVPDSGGPNPDYSALGAPVDYYRTFVDATALSRSSFQIVFTGSFVASATVDLANEDFRIFIRRRASSGGGDFGTAANPLLLHGPTYNFASFDDGVTDGYIRESSSSGNTVNGTFGGFSCETGFFFHLEIVNPLVQIDSISVTFF